MLPPFEDIGEVIALIVLAAILFRVGASMSQSRPRVEAWAWRASAGTFVLDALLYLSHESDPTIATCLAAAIHALIVAWAAIGIFLIAFSAYALVADFFSGLAARAERQVRVRKDARERAEKEKREAEEKRQRDEAWERTRPERERQQREAAERQALDLRRKNAEQKRREDARLRCETLYSLQAPVIKKRFNRSMFDAFVAKYMGDNRPADEVEERADQLSSLITQHVNAVVPEVKKADLGEITAWYVNEKERFNALPIDDEVKDEHLRQLEIRYSELTEEFLEKMRP